MEKRIFNFVAKCVKFTSLSINLWMRRNVMSEFTVKVVMTDTVDVKVLLIFVYLNVER